MQAASEIACSDWPKSALNIDVMERRVLLAQVLSALHATAIEFNFGEANKSLKLQIKPFKAVFTTDSVKAKTMNLVPLTHNITVVDKNDEPPMTPWVIVVHGCDKFKFILKSPFKEKEDHDLSAAFFVSKDAADAPGN